MARKPTPKGGTVTVDLGRPNSDKQIQFFESRAKYTCYGGARGGGKSWCTQRKSVGGCLRWPGIRILVVRRRYEDLENSVIDPILKLVNDNVAIYNASHHLLTFLNGSTIKFGNMESYGAATTGKYEKSKFKICPCI